MTKEEVRFMAKKKRRKRKPKIVSESFKSKMKFRLILLLFLSGQVIGWTVMWVIQSDILHTYPVEGNGVYVTAAHLSQKQVGYNYRLLYKDKNRDIAYYLNKSYIPPTRKLQPVYIKGLSGAQIVSSSKGEFIVKVSDPQDIVGGMSGHRIYNYSHNRVLGFISALLPGGSIKCIAID